MSVRAAEAVDARGKRPWRRLGRISFRAVVACLLTVCLLGPSGAHAGETPRVRTATHADFARLVLEFPKKMPAKAEIREDGMTIVFERPVDMQASLPVAKLGGYLRAASLSGDGRTLTFTFARPLRVETTTYRSTLVFDLLTNAKVEARDTPEGRKPDAKKAADRKDAKPKKAEEAARAPAEASPDKTAEAPKAAPAPANSEAAADSAAALKLDQLANEVAAAPPPPPLPVVRLEPEMLPNGVRLTTDWPVPVPAAIFVRGDRLWLVFDAAAQIDAAALTDAFAGAVREPTQIAHPAATVLTVHLARPLYPVARRRGGAWVVDLTDSARTPERPIAIEREDVSTGQARALLPTTDPVNRLVLADPDAGDEISVVPLTTAGSAMALQRDLPQVRLLATAQGMAIVPLADDIAIEAVPTGVAISAPGGLTISPDRNTAATAEAEAPKAVVDWAAWSDDHGTDPAAHRRELVRTVSAKPAGERNPERLALARNLVAHQMGADALGVLRIVATNDPNIANDPEFRALRGIANVQMGRYDDAAADLAHPDLEFDPHASLWRSRIATARRNWHEAREQFAKGADGVAAYEPAEQARFRLDAARAAIGAGDLDTASGELPDITVPKGETALVATKAFLDGQLAQAQGDAAAALTHYDKAVAKDWRPIRVEAEFARTNLEFTEGKISAEEATNRLERLRYSWRGDAHERMVLGRLATLYAQRLDWRSSLAVLRDAVTAFPKAPETAAFKVQMADIFQGLFLKGGADALTPVSALALYYDFRELTPNGPDGDEMIRKLADRLASVDLLDRAAELLEHQVRYRLNGAAKAQVAARLALVHLLDRQPEKALEALDKSEQPLLPDTLASQRRLLRARALADLDRPKDALDVLADDQSVPASELISEIAWKAEAWPLVAATNETLLGTRWKEPAPLDQAERGRVLRTAVAMTLSNDAAGLERLRGNWAEKMKGGVGADAFAVITGRVDPRTTAFRNLANTIANIGSLESFMASYRDRVQGSGLSAIN
jgi:hypothetical protein